MRVNVGPERYHAFSDLVRFAAGGGSEIAYAPLGSSSHVLMPDRARGLTLCRGDATLAELTQRLVGAGLAEPAAKSMLTSFVTEGLLLPESALRARLVASDEGQRARIAKIVVPTRRRPESLARALASYAKNLAAFGRSAELVVVDGATSEADVEATERALSVLEPSSRAALTYVGPRERAAYVERLVARADVDPQLVSFALTNPEGCPDATGSSRNLGLLQSVGDPSLQVDDDTLCALARAPGAPGGLAFTSRNDPTEHWFEEGLGEARVLEDADLLSLHESLLGRRPVDVAREHGDDLHLKGSSGMLWKRIASTGALVRTTQLGSAGDSATGSSYGTLLLGGPSRARLHTSEASFRRAFLERRVARAATRATIVDGAHCVSLCLGLDARGLLPPFFPVQRNGNGVFGALLRVAFDGAHQGYLPWTVAHEPPEPRKTTFEDFWRSLGRSVTGDLVCHLVLGSRVEAQLCTPEEGLRAVGATLERWASQSLADFEEIVRLHVLKARSLDLLLMEELLRVHGGQPAYWARELQRTATLVRESAKSPSVAFPSDLVDAFGEIEGRRRFQRLVRSFGRLLGVWPAIVTAAREQRLAV